jgi:toxin-antitoxin system PIN domain toxin
MILVDANLLVYAYLPRFPQHAAARRWLEEAVSAGPRVGIPWPSILAFLRIVSNPRLFERPSSIEEAWSRVEEWLSNGNVWVPLPTERHASILAGLIPPTGGRAQLVPDAHLAALAIEHGLELESTDGDFARFPGLRLRNPLSG